MIFIQSRQLLNSLSWQNGTFNYQTKYLVSTRVLPALSDLKHYLAKGHVSGSLKHKEQAADNHPGKSELGELTVPAATTTAEAPRNARAVRVAILGEPNAGKSSIANALIGNKVLPVSRKVHTTRKLTAAVTVQDDTQMVFLDTPGVVSAKKKKQHFLDKSMLTDPEKSLPDADLIAVVVDAANNFTSSHLGHRILYLLNRYSFKSSFLILNKTDVVTDKSKLLAITASLTGGIVNGRKLQTKITNPNYAKDVASHWRRSDNHISSLMGKYHRFNHVTANHGARTPHEPDDSTPMEQNMVQNEEQPPPQLLRFDRPVHEFSDVQLARLLRDQDGSWPHFQRVFMTSALQDEGVGEIKDFLIARSSSRDWLYTQEGQRSSSDGAAAGVRVDQNPTEFILPIIRSKLLDMHNGPMPYVVKLSIPTPTIIKYAVIAMGDHSPCAEHTAYDSVLEQMYKLSKCLPRAQTM